MYRKLKLNEQQVRGKITIHTGRPGMIIGKGGAEVERLRMDLEKHTGKQLQINIVEIKTPEVDAQLVAENIAHQLKGAYLQKSNASIPTKSN